MDMSLPGIEVRPLRQMTGEAEFDEVFFTDVEMPVDALIGPENEGWMVGMATLTSERGHIGASIIGLERRLEQIASMGDGDLGTVERDRLAALLSAGNAYRATARCARVRSRAPPASLMKLGITELHVRRRRCCGATSPVPKRLLAGRRRGRDARRTGRTHRRRHQSGAAQHHRRTPARPAPRAERRLTHLMTGLP